MKNPKSQIMFSGLTLCVAMAFTSCAPVTPQTRIEKHKPLYDKLSTQDKELIDKGEIKEGMNKDAVFLAWGKPNRETDIYNNSKLTTRWEYTKLKPVYRNSIYGGVTYGRSFYHPHRYYRYGYSGRRGYDRYRGRYGFGNTIGIGTSVGYVPEVNATVNFVNEKVKSWQMNR